MDIRSISIYYQVHLYNMNNIRIHKKLKIKPDDDDDEHDRGDK